MYKSRSILGIAVWLVVVLGGGVLLGQHDQTVPWVPPLRFAGTDALYALRRVAGEANMTLTVDDVKPPGVMGDLAFRRVDMDTRAGPLGDVLAQIKAATKAFDFEIRPDLIYVRSNLPTDLQTNLDLPVFEAGTFEGDWDRLVKIAGSAPKIYLRSIGARRVGAVEPVVFQIEEGDSVLDLLMRYAQASGFGWHLFRSGFVVESTSQKMTVRPSTIRPWRSLADPRPIPDTRHETSMANALASVSARTGTPICVFDRVILGENRGALDFEPFVDTGEPLEEYLEGIRVRGTSEHYKWEWDDDIVLVRSYHLLRYPVVTSLLRRPLKGGRFTGTLGDLGRFINANLEESEEGGEEVVMAGEILPNDPITSLDIAPGTTVEDALLQFAKATRNCFFYNAVDRKVKVHAEVVQSVPEYTFVGAFVTRGEHWTQKPNATLY